MARSVSGGAVGQPRVGGITATSESVISSAPNTDIIIDPDGTGRLLVAADLQIQSQGDLRFADSDNSNFVALQSPVSVATNVTFTLPSSDGTNGQSLVTNGSGTLSFTTVGPAITDNTSDSAANYVLLGTVTSGSLTAARVSSSKLTFQPSTGTLSASAVSVNGRMTSLHTENVRTSSYTLALTDAGGVVNMNNSTSATVTVPTEASVAFPVGTFLYIYRQGTGDTTLAAAAGVTLSKTGNMATNEQLYLRKRDTNSWVVVDMPSTISFASTGGTKSTSGANTFHTYTSGSDSLTITIS